MKSNKTIAESDSEIFRWIAEHQKVNFDLELKKYCKLFDSLASLTLETVPTKKPIKMLVVGAGEGRVEEAIIAALNFSHVELWVIDPAEPRIKTSSTITRVHWIQEFVTPARPLAVPRNIDLLVCLATSRYFDSAIDTYSHLMGHVRRGGLVVLDFLNLPPMRVATTRIMGHQIRQIWCEAPHAALTLVEDLADLSKTIYDRLAAVSAEFRCSSADLGINAGRYDAQQVIYELLFPFWCRPDFSRQEIASQLLWGLMCKSMENPPWQILEFLTDQSLDVIESLDLNSDTCVIIASKTKT